MVFEHVKTCRGCGELRVTHHGLRLLKCSLLLMVGILLIHLRGSVKGIVLEDFALLLP